ncbi:hypothetical protein [Microbacterium arabinogalactanolyticum]|uniref:hypothetical protein n=1 Tax=Microbacterium arabinogalactanolyticum TaxID=69365 RepID=UPI0025552728|nr:hypothetical protein [Microbacterium arabinogalactanolyticum]GLC86298.1 hypothetical protein MIAR_28830 [Microbacterium arabinogalactanolyticum]
MKKNNRMRLVGALLVAGALAFAGAPAAGAAAPGSVTCSEGMLAAGSYTDVTVSGMCIIDGSAQISGSVTVMSRAKAVLTGAEVGGSVRLAADSIVSASGTTVHGSISAANAKALYVFFSHIDGNVSFIGGGFGPTCMNPKALEGQGHNTMIKDSTIEGNVTFNGWSGCWFGFLRNTVGHNVLIANMYANPENVIEFMGMTIHQGLDSTEVVANHVAGVLNCTGNTPAAQIGDAMPVGNTAGHLLGECAAY